MRGIGAGFTRIRVLGLRELTSHKLRVVTSLLVVTVSSALLVAVLSVYGSLTASVRDFNAAIAGVATVEVAGITDSGVPASIAGELREHVPLAEEVVPIVRGSIVIDGSPTVLLGSDYRASMLSPELGAAAESDDSGLSIDDLADGIVVGPTVGLAVGQTVDVAGERLTIRRVLGDEASGLNGGRFVFAYLPLAQRLAGLSDAVDSLLIVPIANADSDALRESVEDVVGDRASVVDPDFRVRQAEVASSVVRDSTLLVSMVSLVIAAFLVFNTMNMAVASRRRSLAMIRALGGRRRHLAGDLLGESALFGVVGGVAGIPIGVVAGRWALSRVPGGSSSVGMEVSYTLPALVPAAGIGAAVLACIGATALAAKAVFSVTPVEAMAPGQVTEAAGVSPRLLWTSGVVGVMGVLGAWLIVETVDGRAAILAGAVYAVGGLILCFALSPLLVAGVRAVATGFAGPGRLAAVNSERAPRRVWATVMTVAVAVSVGIGISGALNNLVGSLSSSLGGLSEPDLYVSSQDAASIPTGPVLDPVVRREVAATPGVRRVIGGQWANVNLGDARIVVQGLERGASAPFLRKASQEAADEVLNGRGILLSRTLARTLDADVGDELTLATPAGPRQLRVLETVNYVSMDSGVAAVSITLLHTWFKRPGDTYLQVMIDAGADHDAVRRAVARIADAHPGVGGSPVNVYTGEQALAAAQRTAEQSGGFTVAIQWIVSGAAAIALLNTLLLSVLERRREIGVLRSMGASRRFVFRMVLAEAGAIAVIGAVTGAVMGTGLHVLADAILTETTSIDIVYSPLWSSSWYVAVSAVLCLLGAVVPAVRASRQNISESIAAE
ncbi:FtsX-like permease family protein [Gordonia sp. PDNC005]|uniref:FtsX-like permease family protein n=1 Tax=unclassified Gordonia (in: high G+C Gram-positive bacteria) TaxID=2657482 RepID=UPI001962D30E|nr:FtsX-like permease family protein [Gordonia sp. PDNC005]QRY61756.1 FtsX-like permease family protein [Gordonia sp. PDNC005]